MNKTISIIIPARNEAAGLRIILPRLAEKYTNAEIIVVNDGSDDDTVEVAKECGATLVISHQYSMGNGAAIKTGTRNATGEILVFMDADGQHQPEDLDSLLNKYEQGFDMVVGSRTRSAQASIGRFCANSFYNLFASVMVNQKVHDLTSGFRVVNARFFKNILYMLPNGFSYPTTSTMAFFRTGLNVGYKQIDVKKRIGKSHIKLVRDGIRFLLILFKIGTLYSPLKIFLPVSAVCFVTGLSYYLFTYLTVGRFTNMSALLFSTSVIIFLMGLISEQITTLIYSSNKDD